MTHALVQYPYLHSGTKHILPVLPSQCERSKLAPVISCGNVYVEWQPESEPAEWMHSHDTQAQHDAFLNSRQPFRNASVSKGTSSHTPHKHLVRAKACKALYVNRTCQWTSQRPYIIVPSVFLWRSVCCVCVSKETTLSCGTYSTCPIPNGIGTPTYLLPSCILFKAIRKDDLFTQSPYGERWVLAPNLGTHAVGRTTRCSPPLRSASALVHCSQIK